MNKKWYPFVLIAVLLLAVVVIKLIKKEPLINPGKNTTRTTKDPSSSVDRNRGFDRRVSYLEYTEHALCRMNCRKISKADIQDIMRTGTINYGKSDVKDHPCPTYAVQGFTNDGENLRVIFAQCDYKTKVVTCYNLKEDFECHCPGDDDKYKNQR